MGRKREHSAEYMTCDVMVEGKMMVFERVMSHFEPHPIPFCVVST